MKGLILAAGVSKRMQDLAHKQNKVLLDLGDGKRIIDNLIDRFETLGVSHPYITAGFDAERLRHCCRTRGTIIYNPFYAHYGVLGSVWVARPYLEGKAFLLSVGDHYIEHHSFSTFVGAQPDADILVHVEIKKCDDEDMKVFIGDDQQLRTISKRWSRRGGRALGEFTGMVRFSSSGSRLFFEAVEELAWRKNLDHELFIGDALMACHRKQPLAFELTADHRRIDVDFPGDYARACELYRTRPDEPQPENASAAPVEASGDEPMAVYTT